MSAEGTVLLQRFTEYIINPAILLLFTVGFFLFMWGLVQFLWSVEESANRKEGINHMVWGIAGMFIMVAFWGIIMLLDATFNLRINEGPDINRLPDIVYPPIFAE